jgi:hypothetical protein
VLVEEISSVNEELAVVWPGELSQHHFPVHMLHAHDPSRVRVSLTGRDLSDLPVGVQNVHKRKGRVGAVAGAVGIDRQVAWVYLNACDPSTPVLRISLKGTVHLLYSLLDLVSPEDVKQRTLNERARSEQGPFGACPKCGQPLTHDEGTYGLYIKCSGEQCGYTRGFNEDDATTFARLIGVVCENCDGQAVGRRGPSGIFIACANYPACNWRKSLQSLV